jgi:hypothetical protein
MRRDSLRNIAIGTVIIVAFGGAALYSKLSRNACQKSPNLVSVLLDFTDPISAAAQEATVKTLLVQLDEVPSNTPVIVRYVEDDQPKSAPVMVCKPVKPSASALLTNNEFDLKRKWESFEAELTKAVRRPPQQSKFSPIYETVLDVVRRDFVGVSGSKQILLFSDLQEFSKVGDLNLTNGQCGKSPAEQAKRILASLATLPKTKPLDGFTIQTFLYPRGKMSPAELHCVADTSQQVFNGLIRGSSSVLLPVTSMPMSPAPTRL